MKLFRKVKHWFLINPIVVFTKNCWRFRKQMAKFRSFDYGYNLDLFCASLEITRDFMLSENTVSQGTEETAEEIQHFLDLLKRYENSIKIAEEELGYGFSSLENPDIEKDRALLSRITSIEESSWAEAFNLLRDKLRNWWD